MELVKETSASTPVDWKKPLTKLGAEGVVYALDKEGKQPLTLKAAVVHALTETVMQNATLALKKSAYILAEEITKEPESVSSQDKELIATCVNLTFTTPGIAAQIAHLLGL